MIISNKLFKKYKEACDDIGTSHILRKFIKEIAAENQEENSKKIMLKDMIDNTIDEYFKKEDDLNEK